MNWIGEKKEGDQNQHMDKPMNPNATPEGERGTATGWTARGDEFHWEHADGCFIEKDFDGRMKYVLYSNLGRRLSRVDSLEAAYVKHATLPEDHNK